MMGPRQVEQGVLFYNFSLDGICGGGSFAEVDRPLCRPVGTAPRARAVLQHAGTAMDRSGADGPDA